MPYGCTASLSVISTQFVFHFHVEYNSFSPRELLTFYNYQPSKLVTNCQWMQYDPSMWEHLLTVVKLADFNINIYPFNLKLMQTRTCGTASPTKKAAPKKASEFHKIWSCSCSLYKHLNTSQLNHSLLLYYYRRLISHHNTLKAGEVEKLN